MKTRKKIILGLSGGNDSVVAASLLKSQDYDVRCIHFRFDHVDERLPQIRCIRQRPLPYIEKLAKQLDLNLKVEDLSAEMMAVVLDAAIEAKVGGNYSETCLSFHSEVIMPALERHRVKTHSDLLTTGHRVRLVRDHMSKKGMIYRAFEEEKDQSHLLARLELGPAGSDPLEHLLFPMGEIPSSMVAKIMQELRLKDSVEELSKHSTATCIPPSYWHSATFQESHPKDISLAGPYRVLYGDNMSEGHGGSTAHTPGDEIYSTSGPLVVTEFEFQGKAWVAAPAAKSYQTQLVAKDLRWFSKPTGELQKAKFQAFRPRFPDQPLLSLSLFAYTGSWTLVELEKPILAVAAGEVFVLYQEGQLVGSFRIQTPYSPH